ncbi:MAG: choline/carnitine O-acyltransferase [Galactobacter sp.]|uniref:choline/carnitine O-acyltransferase n=1 Tax=Galactobacter sp. TaxID=2676125 RepID=UPI0025BDABF8|nr:choline/carnitine O-acyltransferase [Galactobacter sp.]
MPLPPLPVPKLEHTLQAIETASAALLTVDDPARQQAFSGAIDDFRHGIAPKLQAALLNFAEHENTHGRSWLITDWLRSYYASRTPLPLTSSVGFSLNLINHVPTVGSMAQSIGMIATAHLEWVRGDFPQVTDARGTDLDMNQFAALAGGLRHPQPDADTFRPPAPGGREIGVFVDGRLFVLTVADDAGRPLRQRALERGLTRIAALAAQPRPHAVGQEIPGGFAGFSYLGSAAVAPILDELLTDGRNEATYSRLTNLLFTVTVADHGDDPEERPLLPTLLEPGLAWAYRPLSYQYDLRGQSWSVHVEHSQFDGGMLVDAVGRMFAGVLGLGASTSETIPPEPQELGWHLSPALAERIAGALAGYREEASRLKAVRLRLPRVPDDHLPYPMSLDALHQLTLTVAQLLAYGRVRGVYESVDMRGFQRGRTECLRPVTSQAVALAEALVEGTATREGLDAALAAHRVQVKACKQGNGFDRHLLGLAQAGKRVGLSDPFFNDPTLELLRHDVLSTTSLGTPDRVIDYVFAPTVPEGFGVCYTPYADAMGFVVSWWEDTAEKPEAFLAALEQAGRLLREFLPTLN